MPLTIGVNGRSIPARVYLDGIARAKANPRSPFNGSLRGPFLATGAEIMAQYRRDLQTRINDRAGITPLVSRLHPAQWAIASTPRVILEPCTIRCLNRHQKPRLIGRMREE
jgi:hypothetical protein